MAIEELKLVTRTSSGRLIKVPATIERADGRILFIKSPFSLKDEIKAMKGSKWHGFEEENPRKIWSVEDCQRNNFQLSLMCGEDVFAWFDRDLVRHEYQRPLMPHQMDLTDSGLTYHYQLWAAEMGTGKTLSAQELIERSGVQDWFWIGPKTSLPNVKREFRIWKFPAEQFDIQYYTYEGLVRVIDEWPEGQLPPHGLICDESSRLKNYSSQRSRAVQRLADMIREKWGLEHGYVVEMSGTPSPKTPVDWWSQCEIAWPGFLREGSAKAMEARLAFMVDQKFETAAFKKRVGWKDDEAKCNVCGESREEGPHELDGLTDPAEYHPFVPSKNEVAYLYERLKGLVVVKHKKDCLSLPEKRYRQIVCKPSASTLRVAKALVEAAPNAITGMTLLRELSDGFQYREVKDGKTRCTHCTDGTVTIWLDPEDPGRSYPGTDLLPDEVVDSVGSADGGLPGVRRHEGSGQDRSHDPRSRLPEGCSTQNAARRMRGDGTHRGLRRVHRLRGSGREAGEERGMERGALRPGQLPSPAAQ